MFETVGDLIGSINILGMGIFLLIGALIFAIARGMSKRSSGMVEYGIILASFAGIILFRNDYIKSYLWVLGGVLIIVYALNYLEKRSENEG